MNLSGAASPTSTVEIKGLGIGGEGMEDIVHVTAKVWVLCGDAGNCPLRRPSCTVSFPEDKAIDYTSFLTSL